MAGAGYKLFQTGDVLTAAQVNTYLNEQTVMVFASSAARTSALSGVLAEGMVSYLQDTNAVEVYNGSAWVGVSGAGDITEVQAGTGISVASGTGPIPIITNTVATAFDAAGDLVYGTGADTFAKLSLGTAGQVLKVNSGATAPEWAAASAGALTFISSTALGSSVSVNNCFTSTYTNYLLVVYITSATTNANVNLRLRASGTDTTSDYVMRGDIADVSAEFKLLDSANTAGQAIIQLSGPQVADATLGTFLASGLNSGTAYNGFRSNGALQNSTQYDGFTLYSSATLVGTVKVYGYQN